MDTMQRTDGSVEQTRSGWNPIEALQESVLLKLTTAGILMILLAVGLQVAVVNPVNPGLVGVWTGMLPVWGTALIIVGLGGYTYVQLNHR